MEDSGVIGWYVGEYCELDNFPYMIRDGDGRAIAKVMKAEDARYIVDAAWRAAPTKAAE